MEYKHLVISDADGNVVATLCSDAPRAPELAEANWPEAQGFVHLEVDQTTRQQVALDHGKWQRDKHDTHGKLIARTIPPGQEKKP